MWLTATHVVAAEPVVSDNAIVAIVLAAIGALGGVAVAWVKGKRPEPVAPEPTTVAPAIEAAASKGMESAAEVYKVVLAREQADNEQLERTLAEVRTDRDLWMERAYKKGWTSDDA